MKKLVLLMLFAQTGLAAEKNKDGFEVAKRLSHDALSHDSDAFPKGKVVKTMHVSGYTYFQFKHKDALTWAATSTMELKNGDQVILTKSYPMHDFKSKTLNRTFATILFVSEMNVVK